MLDEGIPEPCLAESELALLRVQIESSALVTLVG
jgi:hypothetical protein